MSPTERDLIEASKEIGGLAGTANWYTEALAARIDETGRRVDDLTVRELRALHADASSEASP